LDLLKGPLCESADDGVGDIADAALQGQQGPGQPAPLDLFGEKGDQVTGDAT